MSCANEHGLAWVQAFPTLLPPTIALPVCHQPDGAVSGFHVCQVSLVIECWPDRLGSKTMRPWNAVVASVVS